MDKTKREELSKKTSIQNFRFQRYMLLRYLLALFFFSNLYWVLGLYLGGNFTGMILPAGLLVLSLPAIAEHVKLYGDKRRLVFQQLHFNRIYFWSQMCVNLVLIVISLGNIGFSYLFPFFTKVVSTRIIFSAILFVGGLLAYLCIHRIKLIAANGDKHYQRMLAFEKAK